MEIKNILLFIVAIITAYLSLFIIRGKKTYSNSVFSIFILSVGLWAFGVSFFYIVSSIDNALFYLKFYYVAAAAIPISFLLFSLSFPREKTVNLKVKIISVLSFITLSLFIALYPDFIVKEIFLGNPKNVSLNSVGYACFFAYFLIALFIAYANLIYSYIKETDKAYKVQLKVLIIGTLIPYLFGMLFNLILPIYTYSYIWIGPLFGLVVVLVVLYAVYKHKLFDTKVLTAEIFTFSMWIFILIRTLIAGDINEKLINVGLLFLTVVIGTFLIRSVKKEVETREKIEKLATDLENANERLQELDKQKSEFVSLASHQLRGPLTAVKGYASMLLDGDFGNLEKDTRDAVEKIFKSTQDLVVIVGDYLDVSRIEQGRMQYDFTTFDMSELVGTVVTELKPNIDLAKLSIDYDYDATKQYLVNADQGKIKQVISNIIDNSIKYTPIGGIHVWLSYNSLNKILISISDTGVGIHPDVLPRLFEKFTRAPDASKTNIMGTGLGLYVAKKMIEAHHGRIWAESAGPGKGASFFIEIDPIE